MKHMFAVIVMVALLAFPSLSIAEAPPIDGNFWLKLDKRNQDLFVLGLFDGLDLGYESILSDTEGDDPCKKKARASYREKLKSSYGLPANQIADGISSFYSDYRNRKILTYHAFEVVIKSINGETQEYIDGLTELYRKYDK